MTGQTHTPGPWFMNINGRERPEVVDAHGEKIVEVYAINDVQDTRHARLIAALPDLVGALTDALFAMTGVADGDFAPKGRTMAEAIEKARAALAKARGQ